MFRTTHTVHFDVAADMSPIGNESVDLIVTSPPYPMIAMWDASLAGRDSRTGKLLSEEDGPGAFESMHQQLDPVWRECWRVLREGGFACVNIGDAVRTVRGTFQLYPNHARILSAVLSIGFSPLPAIIWRKPTNAPTKFMGSGMLPAGAYVTLEHEYILILRKGGKRNFRTEEARSLRQRSAIFWEERNQWFSDVWVDLRGTSQELGPGGTRSRSAAFPLELAQRLIYMYSVQGDVVLDPFLGTGTTAAASAMVGRHSAGFELDASLEKAIDAQMDGVVESGRAEVTTRLAAHQFFVQTRLDDGGELKHRNAYYGFRVMTRQERGMVLTLPDSVAKVNGGHVVEQVDHPP